jgi:oligoendopeptidase F
LGSEYTSLLQRAKDERWIDVMPNKNKDSGAYSWGAYGALPVVSLNFVGDSNSMFTLAHELGHCLHTYFSNKNQPQEKSGYTIFVAEVASTVNEMLLCQYLLKNAQTNQEKTYYCDYLLGTITATVFRQTQFSQFEKIIHDYAEKGLPLSKDILNKTYMDLQKKYYGKDVEQLQEMQYEWSRIPHFYNSFYVYKYATGLISAMAITKKILSGEKDAVQNYLKFLTLGCSLDPVKSLCIAGSDLTNPQTFKDGFEYMGEIVSYWESLS